MVTITNHNRQCVSVFVAGNMNDVACSCESVNGTSDKVNTMASKQHYFVISNNIAHQQEQNFYSADPVESQAYKNITKLIHSTISDAYPP